MANAVLDGTDAVMLSGETAAGRYPVQALEMMDAIIREVESDYVEDLAREFQELKSVGDEDWPFSNAAARAAAVLTTHLPLRAVVVFTQDGRSAGLLAEHRPKAPILAITSHVRVARRLALEWGVIPRIEVPPESLDETLQASGQDYTDLWRITCFEPGGRHSFNTSCEMIEALEKAKQLGKASDSARL